MRVGVVGGGINGICVAWEAAERGHQVTLFERGELMGQTSSASTKLLHGGLRYLEHGEFRLVSEALRERDWWLQHAGPDLAWPIEICLPVYRGSRRSRWWMQAGLQLYSWLGRHSTLRRYTWVGRDALRQRCPSLKSASLQGAFFYFDGQMDDRKLGLWAAAKASEAGVAVHAHQQVSSVTDNGEIRLHDGHVCDFDTVVNVSGPWAKALLDASDIRTRFDLDLVRGSHLLLRGRLECGYLFEHPMDGRPFFALPFQGNTLVGTTEVRQSVTDAVVCSDAERDYLLAGYNAYFEEQKQDHDVRNRCAGLRPLLKSADDPNRATREYEIERCGRLYTVWGGKWTTARALARRVVDELDSTTPN
jgi:glycerol-3-phosphate dehydrogenase